MLTPSPTSPDLLAALAGIVLSLAFAYIPQAREWFDALSPTYKRLTMLALLAVSAFIIWLGACIGWVSAYQCTPQDARQLAWLFVQALVANQAAFLIAPKASTSSAAEAPNGQPPSPTP